MAAKKTVEEEEAQELTALEEFLALDGAGLVVAPNALPPSKRARAYAVFTSAVIDDDGDGELTEEQMTALLDVSANALEWVEDNAVKDMTAYMAWAQDKALDDLMSFAFTYIRAVGEM